VQRGVKSVALSRSLLRMRTTTVVSPPAPVATHPVFRVSCDSPNPILPSDLNLVHFYSTLYGGICKNINHPLPARERRPCDTVVVVVVVVVVTKTGMKIKIVNSMPNSRCVTTRWYKQFAVVTDRHRLTPKTTQPCKKTASC
jgi:hypothetical protein